MQKSNIGLIGLAVMGANLARNIANNSYKISVYNRTTTITDEFINNFGGKNLVGFDNLKEFVDSLELPRKIIIMVKAGNPVDILIEELLKYISKDDIIIDCGNSYYKDTTKRYEYLESKGINFVGCGVSGGEEGALKGPSIMPGCKKEVYNEIKDILESISAKDFNSGKCVVHIGDGGSGHFVKMVHNGIEYGVMQMIAEGYDSLKRLYFLNSKEISSIFKEYNNGRLNSYLFEITYKVLEKQDDLIEGKYLIDSILDVAGAKGTGLWTSIDGLERQQSISTIGEATFARAISGKKDLRIKLQNLYGDFNIETNHTLEEYIVILENSLYLGILFTYAQGYSLIQEASNKEKWNINISELSRIWQGGCIIRAELLDFLTKTFLKNDDFEHIFELEEIKKEILEGLANYKNFLNISNQNQIPTPSLSAGIQYFYSITKAQSSANLIQGLRDYFGAHTYLRTDMDGIFHTKW